MELEDLRDDLGTQLGEARQLLSQLQAAARTLAEQERTLRTERDELAEERRREAEHGRALAQLLDETNRTLAATQAREADLARELAATAQAREAAVRQAAAFERRINELAAERLAVRQSLSWRIAAPLRWLERRFRRRGGAAE